MGSEVILFYTAMVCKFCEGTSSSLLDHPSVCGNGVYVLMPAALVISGRASCANTFATSMKWIVAMYILFACPRAGASESSCFFRWMYISSFEIACGNFDYTRSGDVYG